MQSRFRISVKGASKSTRRQSCDMDAKRYILKAGESDNKKRLDLFFVERLPENFSRSYIQKLILERHAALNGKTAKSHTRVRPGDTAELTVPPAEKMEVSAENIPLNVIFEDEHLIVISKAAGMVVHPAAGNRTGTLVNALLAHCRDLSGIGGKLRPGIVHRLDKDTSGLLVVAKDDYTHRALSRQLKRREIKRRYIAFVRGIVELDNGTIDMPIGRSKRHRQKMAVGFSKSRDAVTHYRVLKRFDDYTMVEVILGTGRTHQIRTHMEYLGYPLLGDKKYGRHSRKIGRQALHAASLEFTHPITKKNMRFESDLPEDMKRLC